jgi:hypothetical protein
MKKIARFLLFGIMFTGQFTFAQNKEVPLETVRQFANSRASVIWGITFPDEPMPLYSIQDELIGYSCNFSIGQPFPNKEILMQRCAQASTGSEISDRWLEGEYGSMLVSATKISTPLLRFSKVVSDEYAYGKEIRELAKAKLNGQDCELYRVYLMNILAKWYCYKAGDEKVYVKVCPPIEVYTEEEFKTIALAKYDKPGLWALPADASNEWQAYFDGQPFGPLVDHLIPSEGVVPFYDWSFGCTPTAFSMALGYWDNLGMTSASDYGNLVKYHLQRYDAGQSETDKNVPDLQRALAIAMSTDSIGGGTNSCCWLIGFLNATNARGYNFSGSDLYGTTAQYWTWAKAEINAGRTFHMGTPGHSSTGVGYTDANQVIVHNTWWGANDYFAISDCDLVGTIIPGGQYGAAVSITSPYGDPRYSDLATLPNQGEDLYAGDAFEITWNYDYLLDSYVRLSYSTTGGTPWHYITYNTPNDGHYDWRIPAGIANSTLGRVRVEVLDPSGNEAADGSYGNFDFHAGGSLLELTEDIWNTASTDPDYFQFTNTSGYWSVVGVRPNVAAEDWDISLFDDVYFSNVLASSTYGGSTVDFVVVDGNHSPSVARGIKASRYSGSGSGRVEFEGGMDIITTSTPMTETWTAGDVVEMWDVYLTPGYYKCTMLMNSGTADMGMALFNSAGVAYYGGRPNNIAVADSYGAGLGESFWVTISATDYYGLCIFAKDANPANITVKFETQGQWLGMVSNDWYDPANWSAAFVPTSTIDVTINPGYTFYPVIASGVANCNNITIGAGCKISLGAGDLNIAGNMVIVGQVEQTSASADFFVTGSVLWESGSTANITAGGRFHVETDWEFRAGSAANLANGYVYFEGTNPYSYIRSYDAGSSFKNVLNYKTAGYIYFSSSSSDTLKINGYYYNVSATSLFYSNTNYPLVLKGQLYNYGHIYCPYGTFIFDGASHTVDLNTGDYFNNVIVSSAGSVTLADSLRVNGSLTINSGYLVTANYPIFVKGNWTNTVGTVGFLEGTGKVVFNGGNYHQYCSNETFYTLEVDKPLGGAFRTNGTNVLCQSYDWTAGAVDVLSGSFTASDLADDAIAGNFYLNAGGTINLYNTDGWVDLKGYLNIFGGTFNVYGGNGSDSYWPYFTDGGVTMSAGILDFKNVGVYVYNSPAYTFTESITGGTIRTSRGFSVNRSDYTPIGGAVEFYGPTDGSLSTTSSGYLHDILIHKGALDGPEAVGSGFIRNRETSAVTDAPLTNSIYVSTAADINGDVTIQSGVLSGGTYPMYVEGNWTNLVGTAGFTEGTSTVEFNGANDADVLSAETFYNVNMNKTYLYFDGLELMQDVTVSNDLHIMDGVVELNDPADLTITGNLAIDFDAGLNANDTYSPQVYIGKNWTNANTSFYTEYGFDPGYYSTVTFNGSTDQYLTTACTEETFNNLTVNKSALKFRTNDNIMARGSIEIAAGIWDDGITGLYHTVTKDFTVQAGGAFYNAANQNTVEFYGLANSVLTYSGASGYFHNMFINKMTGYSVTQVGNTSCQYGGHLAVENGDYLLNGYNLTVFGDITVNDAGRLVVPASSTLTLADTKSLNVNSGGRIDLIGTPVNTANVRANISTSRYAFNINANGTIGAEYAVIKNTGSNGVYVSPSGIVDLAHAFRGCTFQDGAAGGTLLALNNAQVITIRNASFPTNTWGGNSNVAKTLGTGHVYFVDFTGGFSGEAYDADGFNLIDWVPTLTATATATPGTICAGSSTQLNVIRSGGLPGYTYQWIPATGLSNPAIINPVATPAATTTYYCNVTDALGTVVSSSGVTVTVNPYLPVSVNVTASANPSPPGNFVTFTATPVNGGASPSYQWRVNGANVGTGLPTYSYVPSYNDMVYCIVTSNYACPSGNPAASNIINMIVVPVNYTATGIVPSPLHLCFDASNTLTVAGGGTSFLVSSGASVNLIAGVKISMLYGTTVQPGGYLHGYITTTNAYCGSLPAAMVAVVSGVEDPQLLPEPASMKFSIYPNPTNGVFTLQYKGDAIHGKIQVEIYGMRGEHIMTTSYIDERSHLITLPSLPPGLCFVKISAGDRVETFKLVVTR